MEAPEDLGRHELGDPASIWALKRVRFLAEFAEMGALAFSRCSFDPELPGREPTRDERLGIIWRLPPSRTYAESRGLPPSLSCAESR